MSTTLNFETNHEIEGTARMFGDTTTTAITAYTPDVEGGQFDILHTPADDEHAALTSLFLRIGDRLVSADTVDSVEVAKATAQKAYEDYVEQAKDLGIYG